jgi:hypothetical protein
MTKVVNVNNDVFDVFIGRPSIWGNPFEIGKDGTRKEVIQKYKVWLNNNGPLKSRILELDGKILGCFCAPKACHGNVIIEMIEIIKREKFWI